MNREEMIFSLLQRRINTMFNGYACIEHGCLDGFPKGLNQMTNEELMNEYDRVPEPPAVVGSGFAESGPDAA